MSEEKSKTPASDWIDAQDVATWTPEGPGIEAELCYMHKTLVAHYEQLKRIADALEGRKELLGHHWQQGYDEGWKDCKDNGGF